MAKTFVTNGTGSQQTLSPIQNEKIPIYATRADAEADLSNLAENQIVATKDLGYNVAVPVDVIENGNMHAVTSNAVYNALLPTNSTNKGHITLSGGFTIAWAKVSPSGTTITAVLDVLFSSVINVQATMRNNNGATGEFYIDKTTSTSGGKTQIIGYTTRSDNGAGVPNEFDILVFGFIS